MQMYVHFNIKHVFGITKNILRKRMHAQPTHIGTHKKCVNVNSREYK